MNKLGKSLTVLGSIWVIGYSLLWIVGLSTESHSVSTFAYANPVLYWKALIMVICTPLTWIAIAAIWLGNYLQRKGK